MTAVVPRRPPPFEESERTFSRTAPFLRREAAPLLPISQRRASGPMQFKLINDGPQKTYVLVLRKGDEVVSVIEGFARDRGLAAAQLTAIGALSDAVLGFFD